MYSCIYKYIHHIFAYIICIYCFNWKYESRCFDFVKFQSFSRGFPRPGQKQQRNGWRSPNSLIGVDSQGWCDVDWSWNNLSQLKLINFHTELWVFEGDRVDGLRTCLCVWGIMWFPAPRTLRSERRSGLSWLHGYILLWLHRSQCHCSHFGIYMHFVPLEVQYIAFCAPEVPGSRTSKIWWTKIMSFSGVNGCDYRGRTPLCRSSLHGCVSRQLSILEVCPPKRWVTEWWNMFTTFHDTSGRKHNMHSILATPMLQVIQETKYDIVQGLPV